MEYKQQDTQDRILAITGTTSNIEEALDQWENERAAMAELHTENKAYEALISKLRSAVALAEKAIGQAENDAGMWLKENTRHTIYKLRELTKQIGESK